jgi:hypothetical protein
MDEFLEECKKAYGEAEGFRIYTTILPGILGDFRKMLTLAKLNTEVSEEYKIDDGKRSVKLTGKRLLGGNLEMHAHLI